MIRVRRAVVLSLLCLLAFTTPAAAESAWVLWVQEAFNLTKDGTSNVTVNPIGAFTTQALCERDGPNRVDQVFAGRLAQAPEDTVVTKRQGGYTITDKRKSYVAEYWSYCLPDTVDPRGPKGSGQ